MRDAITVCSLRKSYGNHEVLDGLDFSIQKGKIFSLLGVNKAGKTMTLECIEGLRKYDGGSVAINGRTGIQLQSAEHMKALEAIRLFSG